MATRPTATPKAMCCVSIDYQDYLLPLDKGMKLIELLQAAVRVDHNYDRGEIYRLHPDPIKVSMKTVQPNQVRKSAKPGENGDPLALENNPSDRLNF